MTESTPATRIDTSVLGWGVALILGGLLLTLVQLDLVEIEGFARLWPFGVIAVGLWLLATGATPKKRRDGLWVALVGVYLLVTTLRLFGLWWHNSWPLVILFSGVLRIFWPHGDEDRGGGFVELAAGTWLLLAFTHTFGLDWRTSWPLLLVFVGVSLVIRALVRALPALRGERS